MRDADSPQFLPCFLDPYFETGTEGVIWSANLLGAPGYDALVCLEEGDQLRVLDDQGRVAWSGVVALEYDRRHRPYPGNPQYGQQEIKGFWVHGFQSDLPPEVWSEWFFSRRRAWVCSRKAPAGSLEEHVYAAGVANAPPHVQLHHALASGPEELQLRLLQGLRHALSRHLLLLQLSPEQFSTRLKLTGVDEQILQAFLASSVPYPSSVLVQSAVCSLLCLFDYGRFQEGVNEEGFAGTRRWHQLRQATLVEYPALLQTWRPKPPGIAQA